MKYFDSVSQIHSLSVLVTILLETYFKKKVMASERVLEEDWFILPPIQNVFIDRLVGCAAKDFLVGDGETKIMFDKKLSSLSNISWKFSIIRGHAKSSRY